MALKRRRTPNRWLSITQIIVLTLALVMLLFFRDMIATGASNVVGAFGHEDIRVQAPSERAAATPDKAAPGEGQDAAGVQAADESFEIDLDLNPRPAPPQPDPAKPAQRGAE